MNSRTAAGEILEDAISHILKTLRDEGKVIIDFTLNKSHKYPDFWVLDALGRQWLIEAKNLGIWRKYKGGRHSKTGMTMWIHNRRWVAQNIASKDWDGGSYRVRGVSGQRGEVTVHADNPKPILVISHMLFDSEALQDLKALFGDFIAVIGHQVTADTLTGDLLSLYEQLRRIFTTELRGEIDVPNLRKLGENS